MTTSRHARPPRFDANIVKAGVAALWMYGGRGIGLLWVLAVVAKLGIGDYGQYAMAFALGAIIAAPLDHPFGVRAIRESEERYVAERTTRVMVGVTLIVAGVVAMPFAYVVWFALVAGGGEVVFNAYKSRALRDGDPQIVQRMDTARQATSILIAIGYLFLAPNPSLFVASVIYVAPYFVIAVLSIVQTKAARPAIPGGAKEIAILFTEQGSNAIYIQGDILLLGFLTDSTIAGYYSVAVTLAWAAASFGQSFSTTFHEKLRAADGHVSAGPPLKHTIVIAFVAGSTVLIIGLVLLLTPVSHQLALAMIIMSVFVAMRSVNYVFTTVLYLQHMDSTRVGAAVVLAILKMVLVCVLYRQGAIGAAFASVITDLVLLFVYFRAIYGPKARSAPAVENISSDVGADITARKVRR